MRGITNRKNNIFTMTKLIEELKLPEIIKSCSKPLNIIYTTHNYGLFDFIGGNRNLNQSNLKKIKDSMKKKYIDTNAIICILDEESDRPLKIVDGQHRFESCRNLDKDVSYVIDHNLDKKDILNFITLMNTASKEWDVSDFMISESKKGNKNYQLYLDIFGQYRGIFDHQAFFHILNTCNSRKNKKYITYDMFKRGGLEFDDNDYYFLNKRLIDINKYNEYSHKGTKRHYQKALNDLINVPKFDQSRMLYKLEELSQKVSKTTTVTIALKQLQDIYNNKLRFNKMKFIMEGNNIDEIVIR